MSVIPVRFVYMTGIRPDLFLAARLKGSWDPDGRRSADWCAVDMDRFEGWDGCPAFARTVPLDPQGTMDFDWGVELQLPSGEWRWGIMREMRDAGSDRRVRTVRLQAGDSAAQEEVYWLNQSRSLGAQKYRHASGARADEAAIRFSTWAPNARQVEVCIADLWPEGTAPQTASLIDPSRGQVGTRALASSDRTRICGGYIADDDSGPHRHWGPFRMARGPDGVWSTDTDDPALASFTLFDHAPYMFRVIKDNGEVVYRTDLYSRCQIGYGARRPADGYLGLIGELDGSVGGSVVVDPDLVAELFHEPVWPERRWVAQDQFFGAASPEMQNRRLQDLVIYELHVGALGGSRRGADEPGTLADACQLLDYLDALGVNAVELLPLSEFGGGGGGWGYATSHYFAIEYSGGGRDQYKHFIRECHRRGIAVILDVVYNHYNHHADRAEWMFDTGSHERNAYYWYEGMPGDYPAFDRDAGPERRGQGGYVDNLSTAWAPRYWEEMVRAMFVSSAIALATEFEVDGFRMDQTTSVHAYNALHADGRPLPHVNAFGAKLLRELTRSLRLVKPRIMLMAEDHSNWDGVTRDPDQGGLGFDAVWYADFYHHLIGDTDKGSDYAKLIKTAGLGDDRALAMDLFAGALQATAGGRKVVYHESHDEAGNGRFTQRTIRVAVNDAPLVGATRQAAEARCRFAAGMTLLSAGIPMFLFGEEVGAEKDFLYGQVLENREDLPALRDGSGARLFAFYQDLIRFRRSHPGITSSNIDVLFVHNEHRLIAFRRWAEGNEEFLIVGSLNNRPFDCPGYRIGAERMPGGRWREVFNSDASIYGGQNVGNRGAVIAAPAGALECVIPACGVLVFQRAG